MGLKRRPQLHVAWVAALLLLCSLPAGARAAPDPLTLWYDHPAADWEREGLPIGNGAMGAMVLGGVAEDDIQFNEKTLWTGGPGSGQGYDFGLPAGSLVPALKTVRDQIDQSKRLEPEQVAAALGHKARGYGDYQSFGSVVLKVPAASGVTGYRRELDIGHAVARLRYTQAGVHYLREYFADYPDRVIVIRLSADKPGRIGFSATIDVPDNRSVARKADHGRISVSGALTDNGLRYESQLQILAKGGRRSDLADGIVRVAGADSAVLILAARTNYATTYPDYRGAEPQAAVQRDVDLAAARSYHQIFADHEKDYRALFGRVALNIGQAMPDLPTDQLLSRYEGGAGAADRALEALYFQYGRYLLIASSRAGSLPANLQGVWNRSATPPWNADYHVNINLQMNYWLADPTNLAETTAPLFDFVDGLGTPGRESARRIFGARGWLMNLNTNPWGYTGLIDWPTAFWQPEGAAWLCQHYYDHYRFTGDEAFLRARAYPVMKAVAEFWLDALVSDPRDGKLVVSPSYSPEHGPFSAGGSMSQEIVFDLFTNVSEAAKHLGDDGFGREIDVALAKLDPGLRIGSWGQLQEWKEDWDDPKDDHRHVSHLFALHPGRQISPLGTPAFAQAARVSLMARGDGGTGWSKAWKINFWARLLDGDHAHRMLGEQLRQSTLPNLWDTHPPFQIDGNFGATAGVAEMLLQSQNDEIHILPALPHAWPSGSVRGLRARGDVTAGICWSGGLADEVVLAAGRTAAINLRSTMLDGSFLLTDQTSGAAIAMSGSGERRSFQALTGHTYLLRRGETAAESQQQAVQMCEAKL
jgi:alpha-L-fucosidase 2